MGHSPQSFSGAHHFNISGPQINISGPHFNNSVSSNSVQDNIAGNKSDPAVYARLLMTQKRGYPLWKPKDYDPRLPDIYKRDGVHIGDVGILDEFGGFDYLFNACHPADHSLNEGRVPENFKHLEIDNGAIKESPQDFEPGSFVESKPSCIGEVTMITGQRLPGVPDEVGSGLKFISSAATDGALLILPEGGKRIDHRQLASFCDYAAECAQSWYAHVKGRGAHNGALYLVTGFDKTRAWGVASFTDANPGSVCLEFVPKAPTNVGLGLPEYRFRRRDCASLSDADNVFGNQSGCVFLRGFKIAVRHNPFTDIPKLCTSVKYISDLNTDELFPKSEPGRNFSTQHSPQSYHTPYALNEYSVLPNRIYHPLDVINAWVLSNYDEVEVSIAHDNDWTSVIQANEEQMPSNQELIRRISEHLKLVNSSGLMHARFHAHTQPTTIDAPTVSIPLDEPAKPDSETTSFSSQNLVGAMARFGVEAPISRHTYIHGADDYTISSSDSFSYGNASASQQNSQSSQGNNPVHSPPSQYRTTPSRSSTRSSHSSTWASSGEQSIMTWAVRPIMKLLGRKASVKNNPVHTSVSGTLQSPIPILPNGHSSSDSTTLLSVQSSVSSRTSSPAPVVESPSFQWIRGDLIGKGSYGRVYWALNITTGDVIAVKQVELEPNPSKHERESIEALKFESYTLRDLDHPNIVQFLGFEESPDHLSIFMEYVAGGTIGSCLKAHGKFHNEVTKFFAGQMLEGLEYLHSRGVIHRDIKADNILVEKSGTCKISDFGISKQADAVDGRAFTERTVYWMAPEAVNPKAAGGYTAKIDIWSMGCVVLEMWTGRRPWSGQEVFPVLMKLYGGKQPPPIPAELLLSEDAMDFRNKCFSPNAEGRPSAAHLRSHPYLVMLPGWTFNPAYIEGPLNGQETVLEIGSKETLPPVPPIPAISPAPSTPPLLPCVDSPGNSTSTLSSPTLLDSPGPPIVYTTPPSSLARLNLQFLPDDSISSSSTSSSSLRSGQKRSFHVGNLDSPSPWQKKFIDLPPGAPDFNLHLAQSMSTLSVRQRESAWARPFVEDIYAHLQEFFPDHDIDKAIVTEAVGASLPSTFGERSGSLKPKKSIRMVTEQRARRSQRQSSRATKLWGSHLEELGGPKS